MRTDCVKIIALHIVPRIQRTCVEGAWLGVTELIATDGFYIDGVECARVETTEGGLEGGRVREVLTGAL